MKIARILMVGAHRIGAACLSLQFDHNLTRFDETYVVCPLPGDRLERVFRKYNIDTTGFVYVNDRALVDQHPELSNWWFADDTRGSWLLQQAMKFLMLDRITADLVFIHDGDTFCSKPYQCTVNGELNLFYNNVVHPKEYYQAFENITGLPRQSTKSFITDMMPVLKSDWTALKSLVSERFSDHWLKVFIDQTPWNYTENLKWFSEYELLGNWALHRRAQCHLTEQHRFEYMFAEQLTPENVTSDINCIIDRNKQGHVLPFDYVTDTVPNLNILLDRCRRLNLLT